MKKFFLFTASLFLCITSCFANKTGLFFQVTSTTNGTTPQATIQTQVPKHPQPYPHASLTLLSSAYHLADPYTECSSYDATQGICYFSVSNTAPKSFTISGPTGNAPLKLCLNGPGPLTCQHYTYAQATTFPVSLLYVVSSSQNSQNQGYVTICPLLNDGATLGSGCIQSASSALVSPQAITFAYSGSTPTMAYIPNYGNGTIANCPVTDTTTGALGACTSNVTGIPNPSQNSNAYSILGAVALSGGYVFVAYHDADQILSCPINSNGSLGTCVNAGGSGFNGPNAITIVGSTAYIPNQNAASVVKCTVAAGGLNSCATFSDPAPFIDKPLSVGLDATNVLAYVANSDGSLLLCDSNFGTCGILGVSFQIGTSSEGPVTNIFTSSLSSASGYGYFPNAAIDQVSICSGNFISFSCSLAGSSSAPYNFLTPTGVAVANVV